MWTKERLTKLVKANLGDHLLVVVSNREPYIHTFIGDEIKCETTTGGLTTALNPVMQACGGTWIAHGSGDADRDTVDYHDKVKVPPENPKYSLRRLWLSREQEDGYYYGFSNNALWPLCHTAYTRPTFDESDWDTYKRVNQVFADAVLDEVGNRKAIVFTQDYHLALLPRIIKEANPSIITAHFWHIPWPNPETFSICPWQEEILNGLLGNDLLGFHTRYYLRNFLDTVDQSIEAKISRERCEVIHKGKKTIVRHSPISVDFEELSSDAQSEQVATEMERWRRRLGLKDELIGLCVDRFDYTKGIPERLLAIDHFLGKYSEYHKRVVFIQIGVPSRTHIQAYKRLTEEIDSLVNEINRKYASGRWRPIGYLRIRCSPTATAALRRMADFCIVSSLHDGMNLVAKEYVASRFNDDGVLILSRFSGAAQELSRAIMINPYATDRFGEAIRTAIEMPKRERKRRMRWMRQVVRENNIYKWAADMISEIINIASQKW